MTSVDVLMYALIALAGSALLLALGRTVRLPHSAIPQLSITSKLVRDMQLGAAVLGEISRAYADRIEYYAQELQGQPRPVSR